MYRRLAVAVSAALIILVLQPAFGAKDNSRAKWVSTTPWQISEQWFGGFSGLEVSDDGQSFVMISDRSQMVKGRFERESGKIVEVELLERTAMRGSDGGLFKNSDRDSEGLAQSKDGTLFVSFEGKDRVESFRKLSSLGLTLNGSPAFEGMKPNGAFEALAIDDAGFLVALPENPLGRPDQALVFRFEGKRWTQPFPITRDPIFHPVGADFGPDGSFYLLERAFNGLGFRSQVRRFDVTKTGFVNGVTLVRTFTGKHDNLEGLAVWKDDDGEIRLTMVSDSNFRFVQRTEIVEYVVPENT
ncbi:hypothetical protein SAMN05444000_12626 [Shimia gijangensis]|uniref:Phytase-like domain-containing protein n=1 Tax=Shimia gijangensis TaxID=1470563 RepID=A0A1M6RR82_9RHOB|nr:esterase-like activity of phytase family protein [Shimia gijangensis]SHK34979.1 hypothetical protein SAMN05444000_12626 [Shimia gijangensis]